MFITNLFRSQKPVFSRNRILLASLVAITAHCIRPVDAHAETPIPTENLKVWLRADSIEGLNDGDSVEVWIDQSGNSNDATQDTANYRPTYQANDLNGLPALSFDGMNDHLKITSNAGLEPQTLSAFAVVLPTAAGGGTQGRDLFGKYYGPNKPYASYALELIGDPRFEEGHDRYRMSGGYGGEFQNTTTDTFDSTRWVPIGQATVLSGIWDANPSMSLFVDGHDWMTENVTRSIVYNDGPLTIGKWLGSNSAANSFGGEIAEFLFYDTELPTSDRQLVEGSLAWKYGLQGQLPSDHPYVSSPPPSNSVPPLQPGDADQDFDFDQLDLVEVQVAAKYLSGQAATWGEGDWNGAPGGEPGDPPAGNGFFDQFDVIAALGAGIYLTGPYAAIAPGGVANDGQTSIGYNPGTGEVFVDAPAGTELTSINIDSAAGIFTADPAANLGGSFDNDADTNIFKATFGSSFGSLSFGHVAQTGLSEEFVLGDLSVIGSLAGGGDLGNVDLVYVPEPASVLLLSVGLLIGLVHFHIRREKR